MNSGVHFIFKKKRSCDAGRSEWSERSERHRIDPLFSKKWKTEFCSTLSLSFIINYFLFIKNLAKTPFLFAYSHKLFTNHFSYYFFETNKTLNSFFWIIFDFRSKKNSLLLISKIKIFKSFKIWTYFWFLSAPPQNHPWKKSESLISTYSI